MTSFQEKWGEEILSAWATHRLHPRGWEIDAVAHFSVVPWCGASGGLASHPVVAGTAQEGARKRGQVGGLDIKCLQVG